MNDTVKWLSAVCYLGPLCIIGFVVDQKNDEFLKFHARQGVKNLLFAVVVGFTTRFISWILGFIFSFIPFMNIFISLLSTAAGIAVLSMIVVGMIHAFKGEFKPLPFIGELEIGIFR